MKKESGAALIVVLSLLTISLMVGLSSMQSSQIDERLAGNYRAASQAQMNAEDLASELLAKLVKADNGGYSFKEAEVNELDSITKSWEDFESFSEANPSHCLTRSGEGGACWVKANDAEDHEYLYFGHNIVALGAKSGAVSLPVAVNLDVQPGSSSIVSEVFLNIAGELINVVDRGVSNEDQYAFVSSSNDDATEWEDEIAVNSDFFSSANELKGFRDALYNLSSEYLSDPSGNLKVNFFEAESVKKEDVTSSSGGVLVIEGDDFQAPNNSVFSGVMVVFGNQFRVTGGGNTEFDGVILHLPYRCNDSGVCEYIKPKIEINGGQGSYNKGIVDSISETVSTGSDSDVKVLGVDAWR